MASIVAQPQDMFFEINCTAATGGDASLSLASCREDIFLVAGFRGNQKSLLEHYAENSGRKRFVRLGAGLDGWINKDNPRFTSPRYVILYEFGNEAAFYCFCAGGSFVLDAGAMAENGLSTPDGECLVYRLEAKCVVEDLDLKKILSSYRDRTTWTDGKPLFLSGREMATAMRPRGRKKRVAETSASDVATASLQNVIDSIAHDFGYAPDAPVSIDLFSGCGGLTKGFSMAGIRSIFASDIDENCKKTFERNFPGVPFLCKDITEITKEEVDAMIGDTTPDIIIGGPPCQGFSLANKRRNKIADDPRNRLFYGFVKFLDWYSPRVFVMENVKGLLSMKNGEVLATILDALRGAGNFGYDVAYKVLLASDYGVPQNRERVIFVGTRRDLGIAPRHPDAVVPDHRISVDEAIGDLPPIGACEGAEVMYYPIEPQNDYQRLMRGHMKYVTNHIAMRHTPRLVARFKAIQAGQSLVDVWDTHGAVKRGAPGEKSEIKFSQNNQRLFGDQPAPTIAASFQSNFIHPHLDRNFTAREGARLQSFPDDFIFEGMRTKMSWEKGLSQYQQIGNAVPVLMARAIGECVMQMLDNHGN